MLFFCLVFTCFAEPSLAVESVPNVLMFEIQGNDHVPLEKVLGAISNTKIGQPLDSKNVQLDLESIMAIGYFADVRVKTEDMLGGIKLIFEVIENPAFKELQITGLTKINPNELKPFFTAKPGEIFNATTFKDELGKAINFCKEKKGYLIRYHDTSQLIGSNGVVHVELSELKYGKITIQGLTKTKDYVVRRELQFKEDDIIDFNLLQDSIMKLMQLKIFENPEYRFELTPDPEKVDLVLVVKETVGNGQFYPQLSWSPSTNQLTGSFVISTSNLMGRGQSLSLDASYGSSPSTTLGTSTSTTSNLEFTFSEPWLDSKHTSFQLAMANSDSTIKSTVQSWFPTNPNIYDVDLKQTKLSMSFGRPFGKDLRGNLGLNMERNDIQNPTGSLGSAGPPPVAPIKPDPEGEHKLLFWDNSVDLSLVKNKLVYQDVVSAKEGYYLSGRYKVSNKMFWSAYNYQQVSIEGKWFHQLFPGLVFGTHVTGDWLAGEYPDYDALYLGGMYKLRGYDNYRFSSDPGAKDLIGNQTYLLSTEFRYRTPSNKSMELVVFGDVGQVSNGSSSCIKSDYGMGFRFVIPFMGVLGLDSVFGNSDGASNKLVLSLGETF